MTSDESISDAVQVAHHASCQHSSFITLLVLPNREPAAVARLLAAMPLDKVRIRFRKSGDLRLVSHLDLLRCLGAPASPGCVPFRMTEGFHPTPRLVFALSLPLGVVGHAEVAELEFNETIEPADVLRRLREQAPPGMDFLSVDRISLKATARPRRADLSNCMPCRSSAHPADAMRGVSGRERGMG